MENLSILFNRFGVHPPETPLDEFKGILKIGTENPRARVTREYRAAYAQTRNAVLASRMPRERYVGIIEKSKGASTPEDMIQWCLVLSRQIGVNRDRPEGAFYVAPPTVKDFSHA